MYAIQTVPLRTTHSEPKLKYVRVRYDKKFDFLTSLDEATLFKSVPDAIQAIGLRAQMVNKITNELTIVPVEETPPPRPATVRRAGQPFNGHLVTGR